MYLFHRGDNRHGRSGSGLMQSICRGRFERLVAIEDALALALRHISELTSAGVEARQVAAFFLQHRARCGNAIGIDRDCRKLCIAEMLRKPLRVPA